MRPFLGLVLLAAVGNSPAASSEVVLFGQSRLTRVQLRVEVDGKPLAAIWDDTFARLCAFFDRNGDGALDPKEAALLPAPLALRQALGNGFAPPVGAAPAFADLDRNGDGKATREELAAFYRAAGVGDVLIGVGRLPASAELTKALLEHLDTNGDGKVSAPEWAAASAALKKLDKNDDELIGAGELVPKLVYPGAAGTTLLTPPRADAALPEVLTRLPLVLLPADKKDTHWVAEVRRRGHDAKGAEEVANHWTIRLGDKSGEPFALSCDRLRLEGWVTEGKLPDAVASARRQIAAQFVGAADPNDGDAGNGRRRGNIAWLTPSADRDGNGKLERTELDAWLDLQEHIARGQVLLTVLDGGTGLFELLDTNHDGALSVRELRGAWERLKAAGCLTDGLLDRAKLPHLLLTAASRGYPKSFGIDRRRGPAWFRAMDRNGDGDVSRREFTGPAEVFDKLDADKDGLLNPEEAAKGQK